ncbi:MAG: 2,4-dienoyl-CoA reductase-like NADH-dependent reductase (Old Yellow Enzyme family) [Verrucomicrobiales bacterium]|jgi:2,4-dienoyl-CoA reductase-like NADH-dependent reductase (Old Yellow Enzyme family)
MTTTAPYLEPGNIGSLTLRNRLVRASTSESMATTDGAATPELANLYGTLAAGGAGLLLSGHIFVEPRGQASAYQPGLHHDGLIEPMRQVTDAVHANGGRIFAEIGHAGSQTMMPEVGPIAPSPTANEMYGLQPREAGPDDIDEVVTAFGLAARRAKDAGFDGIHIHGGNGYLISEFSSPITNRRTDEWGGDAERRGRFALAVYDAVRDSVGNDFPVTARIGIGDSVTGGLEIDESLERVRLLADRGLDAVEVSYGIMASYLENIRKYVAVGVAQAAKNVVVQRLVKPKGPEAYYRQFARAVKEHVDIPVILVGGIRTTEIMSDVLDSGDADFLAMARPFIREPDLANKLSAGRTGTVECVSCNMCLVHDGFDPLRCWRTSPAAVASHVYSYYLRDRITGLRTPRRAD